MSDDERIAAIEALAAIEHEQWMAWAGTILSSEPISDERRARWEATFVPYDDLPADVQEFDREWARKALAVIEPRLREAERERDEMTEALQLTAEKATAALRDVERERDLPDGWAWVAIGPQDAKMKEALDAARADADRLAGALRKACYTLWEAWDDPERMITKDIARAALAAHDGAATR